MCETHAQIIPARVLLNRLRWLKQVAAFGNVCVCVSECVCMCASRQFIPHLVILELLVWLVPAVVVIVLQKTRRGKLQAFTSLAVWPPTDWLNERKKERIMTQCGGWCSDKCCMCVKESPVEGSTLRPTWIIVLALWCRNLTEFVI